MNRASVPENDLEMDFQNIIKIEETRVGNEPTQGDSRVKVESLVSRSEGSDCEMCATLAKLAGRLQRRVNKLASEREKLRVAYKEKIQLKKEIAELKDQLSKKDRCLEFQTKQLNKNRAQYSEINQKFLLLKVQMNQTMNNTEVTTKGRKTNSKIPPNELPSSPPTQIFGKETLEIILDDSADEGIERSSNEENQQEDKYVCQICNAIFLSLKSLQSHKIHCLRRSYSKVSSVTRSLPSSNHGVALTSQIRNAQQPASQRNPLQCPVCFKTFLRACGLGSHRRTHVILQRKSYAGEALQVRNGEKNSPSVKHFRKRAISQPH